MRTANDGRGEEPWENPTTPSSDDEATRVFSRDSFSAVPGGEADTTRALRRDPADETTQPLRRAEPADPDATRAFSRADTAAADPAPTRVAGTPATEAPDGDASGEGPSFTRRFVRERPPGRGRAPRPVRGRPEPRPRPEEPRPGPAPRERGSAPPGPRRRRQRRLRLRWVVTLLLLTALALPPGTWAWVWYTARQDDRTASDAIVVLGASQYNGVPSPVFEARLRHAQVLYLEGVAPVIVTVGGKQPGDNFTEAASGRNWLIEVGIPAERIIAVEEGSDTLQSIQAVSLVFEENSWNSATLVSDPWHSLRSQRMAADHGIEAGTSPSRSGPAVIERRTQLWYITRETASLWYYWIFNDSSDIQVNAA
ncbi:MULTISPECIES: YdcF family protein [unclassified Nocardiopsis]|uniref:YdcF family protein n=1 Tax=unclassified Nocardiopsis TaxID=2649073 RepID=UPI00135CD365|nr:MULTISPECIES: YdcF family protein [unclassified Nocardiopsis]